MPLGPVGLGLLVSGINALFGIGSTIAQNQFNSPKAQLRRLRAAGLPLAYMYRGNVATQSQAPQLSIDPQIGFKQAELDNTTKLVKSQVDKNEAETAGKETENEIQNGIRDWLLNRGKVGPGWSGKNNQENNLNIEQDLNRAAAFQKTHEARLKEIQRTVEDELLKEGIPQEERRQGVERVKQQIKNMVQQLGLMTQLSQIREFDAFLNSTVTENINSLPKWARAITAILLKLQSYR